MSTLGYVRVSTARQEVDRQLIQLHEICDRVYEEHGVSAVARSRPAYEQVIADLNSGDTFVVTAIDRVYRSSADANTELDKLHARNIEFRCLALNLDTRSPDGKFFYALIAAMAEWERRIISERTKEGLIVARNKGKRLGRPPKLGRQQITWAKQLIANDNSTANLRHLSAQLGVDRKTLQRALCKY